VTGDAETQAGGRLYRGDAAGSLMPVPDPTKLTTDAVQAATEQYRREMASLRELLETRLNAMDKPSSCASRPPTGR
jgi:hypothetical protein